MKTLEEMTDAEANEIFNAWRKGETIEYSIGTRNWSRLVKGGSLCPSMTYRIKPEPKTVTCWVAVYREEGGEYSYSPPCMRKEDAANWTDKIACVPVTIAFTEGEGL